MTGSLPCDEGLFSTLKFEPQQKELWVQSASKIPSMEQGVRLLMGDEWSDNSASKFGQLNHLDLFILISGMLNLHCFFRCLRFNTLQPRRS